MNQPKVRKIEVVYTDGLTETYNFIGELSAVRRFVESLDDKNPLHCATVWTAKTIYLRDE